MDVSLLPLSCSLLAILGQRDGRALGDFISLLIKRSFYAYLIIWSALHGEKHDIPCPRDGRSLAKQRKSCGSPCRRTTRSTWRTCSTSRSGSGTCRTWRTCSTWWTRSACRRCLRRSRQRLSRRSPRTALPQKFSSLMIQANASIT